MKKDFVKSLAQYSNKYVAFSEKDSRVLASGTTIKEVEGELKKLNVTEAIISYIPPINAAVSPLCQQYE